jgi:DNA-binding CsgD family transcriptional regulator
MIKKIRNAPGWLGVTDDRTAFVFLPDRAEIVRQIFEFSIAGLGGYTIAKLLNAKAVPAFGTSKKWDQSTIHNMLSSRATIGEYQKKRVLEGKEIPVGEPIPNYYPPVIDSKTFEAAQLARRENLSTRRGRKGKKITNLFAEIPICLYCGSKAKLNNSPVKSLVCKTVWDGNGCFKFGWSYANFEQAFLSFLGDNDVTFQSTILEYLQANVTRDDEIYQARLTIAQQIRSRVINLAVAFGGEAPQLEDRDGFIRRDHPDRFFTVTLSDGTSHKVFPPVLVKAEPVLKLNAEGVCIQLRLSPRQGKITTMLAEGKTMHLVAKELGMTLSTARWHLREIFRRTNSHSQAELVDLAKKTCAPTSATERI